MIGVVEPTSCCAFVVGSISIFHRRASCFFLAQPIDVVVFKSMILS